jgi:molecular chaperone HscC
MDNIKLGSLTLKAPRAPAGQEAIDVRFTYDIDGLLEVDVTVCSTGRSSAVVIQREDEPLNEAQIKKRLEELAHLKKHPCEAMANTAVLARAERLYQERLGDERQELQALIASFETELATQDLRRIELARERFSQMLDAQDEGSPF